MRRVVITGLGALTSMARGREATWAGMLAGRDGLGPLTRLRLPKEPGQIAGQISWDEPRIKRQTLCETWARVALAEALDGWVPRLDPTRMGVFQGAGTSGLPIPEAYLAALQAGALAPPLAEAAYQSPCTVTDGLGRVLGAEGPRSTIMNACSSSLLAMGQAWGQVAMGDLDFAVAGGAESLAVTTWAGFSSLKAMDPKPSRPFSADRAGLNLGEAAVQFLLEPLDLAQARGAVIFAEVLGYGASLDAHHPTAPHPEGDGARRAILQCLEMGRLNAREVDLVSAHGTATPANDGAECKAIRAALGEAADRVSVTSTKSQFGHTLGASGAVGAMAAVLALRDQVVSPTLRLETPDVECDLDCTPKNAKERKVRVALINAFAFGGNNVSLALGRWEGR